MEKRRVGVLGSGTVGQTLAAGFAQHGFETRIGTRDPGKLKDWLAAWGAGVKAGQVDEVARFAEIVVLAVKGTAAEEVLRLAGAANLEGKLILDTTNPIADAPPEGGVIKFFTALDGALMERLQRAVPRARFVKAWSSVGAGLMVNPKLSGGTPTMFICGDDPEAKVAASAILELFGWEAEDCGGAAAARAIEPLCILWCIPGFLRNDWTHAFRLLRP